MTDREIMQAVLEAMEHLHRTGDTQVFDMCYAPELIPALKHRLAQSEQESFSPEAISATQAAWKMGYDAAKAEQPEKGPVALVVDGVLVKSELPEKYTGHLYTTPPQRKPLKLREIEKCIYDANNDPIVACRNVEAAHGIKENT